jgi:dipeptidyl aminopeptidase/acylaminoacyl peptidase
VIQHLMAALSTWSVLGPKPATSSPLTRDSAARIVAEARVIGDMQLAPDGLAIVYTVSAPSIETNSYVSTMYLQLLATDGSAKGAPRELIRRVSDRSPVWFKPGWCPTSECFTYVDDLAGANRSAALVRYELTTHRATAISLRDRETGVRRSRVTRIPADARRSPRGTMLAFVAATSRQLLDPRRGVNITPGRGWESNSGSLVVLDVASGIVTQLTPDSIDVSGGIAWSPDEASIAFAATTGEGADGIDDADVFVVDRPARRVRRLTTGAGADLRPSWSPDGRWISLLSRGKKEYGAGWLAVVPAAGGPVSYIQGTGGADPFPFTFAENVWTPDSRFVYFSAPYRMNFYLYRATVPASPRQTVPRPKLMLGDALGFNEGFSFSKDARRVALLRKVGAHGGEIYIADFTPDGLASPRQLTHVNDRHTFRDVVRVDTVSWRSPDKKFVIHGVLLTPRAAWQGDRVTQRLPTLVNVKTYEAAFELGSMFTQGQFAAQGYAVFIPQMRGRNGNGADFLLGMKTSNSYVRVPLEDVLAGVDALIDRGIADSARLGLLGHSQGGRHAVAFVTMTDRFKATVDHEGSSASSMNISLRESNTPDGFSLNFSVQAPGDIYNLAERRRVEEESPAYNLNRVHTPTLLLYGATSLGQDGQVLFGGLQRFGVPSELVMYDEGHVTTRPAAVADEWMRVSAWFDYWLRGMPYIDPQRQRAYDAWRKSRADRRKPAS